MIMSKRKRLEARLKQNKNHVIVMIVCMNAENTSDTQRMNDREQQRIYSSVVRKNCEKLQIKILRHVRMYYCLS